MADSDSGRHRCGDNQILISSAKIKGKNKSIESLLGKKLMYTIAFETTADSNSGRHRCGDNRISIEVADKH